METGPCSLDFVAWCLPLVTCCLLPGALYLVLIGFFTAGWYRQQPTVKADGGRMVKGVSVIIAARNEEKSIALILNDLLRQDFPKELLEIIIVDDHSSDNTADIVNDFAGKNKTVRVILVKNEIYNGSGKKAALTNGINIAKGEIILATDADCRVGPGWIRSMEALFPDENTRMVFGPVAIYSTKKLVDKFQALEFSGLVASGAGAALAGYPFMCSGANLAYRKDAFSQVNGFEGNEKYISGDDVFLLHKMKKAFGRDTIRFCKDTGAMVKTYPATGLMAFLKQRIRWASKSIGYKDALSIFTAIVVFSYSLTVLATFFAGFYNPVFFQAAGGLIVLKLIADLPIMLRITGFTRQISLMGWYLPFQAAYPFYIVLAGFISFFGKNKW